MRSSRLSAITALALVAVFAALASGAETARYAVPTGSSPSIGPERAEITIIEFIDYQ